MSEGLARDSLVLSLSSLLVGAGNYAFSMVMVGVLSPSGYGVFAIVQGFVLLSAWLLAAGIPWTLARRLAGDPDPAFRVAAYRAALVTNMALAGGLAVIWWVAAILGAFRLGDQPIWSLLLAGVGCTLIGGLVVMRGALQGLFRLGWVAVVNLVEVIVKLGSGLALSRWGVTGASLGITVGIGAAIGVSWWSLRDLRSPRCRLPIRELWRENLSPLITTGGVAVLTSMDVFVIKVGLPVTESNHLAGIYQAAVILARVPYFFAAAATMAIYPHLVRHPGNAQLLVRKGVLFICAGLAPISLVLMTVPQALVATLFPSGYAPAAAVLPLLAPGALLLGGVGLLATSLLAVGDRRSAPRLVLAAVVGELISLCLVVAISSPQEVLARSALAGDLTLAVLLIALLLRVCQRLHWQPRWRGARGFAVAALGCVLVLTLLPHPGTLALLVDVATAGVVYGLLARWAGVFSAGDLRACRRAVGLARFRSAP